MGLSGGVDSVVLLNLLAELAPTAGFSLSALHVNHGISPNASAWSVFCEGLCQDLRVALAVEAVDIRAHRGLGLEAAARQARYEAFARLDADVLVLAQHRDDQAETVLLQLLRGAGVPGLSAMPAQRPLGKRDMVLLRPLLRVGRAAIESYARASGLRWVEDESNSDTARARNFLRHAVLPLLDGQFPAARDTLARTAGHLAEAAELLRELARQDYENSGGVELRLSRLRQLSPARARNLLRFICEQRGLRAPAAAHLAELLRQLTCAGTGAEVSAHVSGWTFRRYGDRVYLDATSPVRPDAEVRQVWNGEPELRLSGLGGVLHFEPCVGSGLSAEKLRLGAMSVRGRLGGERLRPDCTRPRRTLKNLLQEREVPPWQRMRMPLVYCGEDLVCVPGIGNDCAYQARADEPGWMVRWEPFA